MANDKTWSFKDATDTLIDMEVRLGLLDGQSEFSKIWERIRFWFHRELLKKLELDESSLMLERNYSGNSSFISWIADFFKSIFYKNPFFYLSKPKYLFISNPRRRLNDEGFYDDIYTDNLVACIENNDSIGSVLCLEGAMNNIHLKPTLTKNLQYLDFINQLILLLRKFHKIVLSTEEAEKINCVESEILRVFGIRISILEVYKNEISYRKYSILVYRALFKHLKPNVLFLVCSYGKENIIEAARLMGINTVEVQHGVLNKYHLGYSFPNNLKKISFPDYFFSFGKHWIESTEFPVNEDRLIVIGYPYLTSSLKKLKIDKKRQIVILSQPNAGSVLVKVAQKLYKKYGDDYRIIYKLHPKEIAHWRDFYPELVRAQINKEVEVVDSISVSLYEIQAQSEYQIGVNSTAIYEGLALGCKTLIVRTHGFEYMESLIEKGLGYLYDIDNPLDIVSLAETAFGSDYFFDDNFENNFYRGLSYIEDACLKC